MAPDEFNAALLALGWKQSDLARRLDLDKNTPSRWANGHTPIPGWASEYLGAMLGIQRLHAAYVVPRRATDAAQPAPAQPEGAV